MKTVYRVLAAAAIAAVSAGCAKEEIEGQSQMPQAKVEMAFTSEAASTRTQLVDGSKVIWTEGDAIGIFGGAESAEEFSLLEIDADDASKAVFTGSAVPAETYYAIYPYHEGARMANGVISTVLPSEQEAVSGTFGTDVNLSAAVSTAENSLSFRNVCGLVSLEISSIPEGYTLQAISIEGQNGEKIAGDVNIAVPDLTATAAETAGTSVTVKAAENAGLEAGTYVFTILPADFTKGLKFTFDYGDAGKSELVSNQAVTVAAGKNHQLPAVAAKAPEGTAGNPYKISDAGELLAFASAAGEYAAEDVVVLTADIDMDGKTWTPFVIGCTLDGQGHKIYNVTSGQGALISQVTGTLKNVVFGSEDGQNYDGKSAITLENGNSKTGLVQDNNGTLENVTTYIPVTVTLGGTATSEVRIAGLVASNYSNITSCANYGDINVSGTYGTSDKDCFVGGITGWASQAECAIKDTDNHGDITVNTPNLCGVGGIVGMNRGENIDGCENTGALIIQNTLPGEGWVGGIVGFAQQQSGSEKKVFGCKNSGAFSITTPSVVGVGGIFGCINYSPADSDAITIENCTNESDIAVTTANSSMHIGGILAREAPSGNVNVQNKITGCTNSGDITLGAPAGAGNSGSAYIGGIAGKVEKKSVIENNTNTGAVIGTKLTACHAGGILGHASGSALTLTGNDNSGSVKLSPDKSVATQCYAGGILGTSASDNAGITANTNSAAEVSIVCNSASASYKPLSYVGGIVGGTTDDKVCSTSKNENHASVSSDTQAIWVPTGGIMGLAKGSVSLSGDVNLGDVTLVSTHATLGDMFAGGIIGLVCEPASGSTGEVKASLSGVMSFADIDSDGLSGFAIGCISYNYTAPVSITDSDSVFGGTSVFKGGEPKNAADMNIEIGGGLLGYKNKPQYKQTGNKAGNAEDYGY